MPIFEFECTDCSRSFEELVRSASNLEGVVCPHCGSEQVRKKLSSFASRVSGGGSASFNAAPAASCSTGST